MDDLYQKAEMPDNKVFEFHGNMQWVVCLSCGRRYPMGQIKIRFEEGEETPACEACHGILKLDVVFFDKSLPEEVLKKATFHS